MRTIRQVALLLSLVFAASPFLRLLASSPATTMSCCRKGKVHACCARSAKAKGAGMRAVANCQRDCCTKAQLPGSSVTTFTPEGGEDTLRVAATALRLAGTGQVRATALPDPCFQRPPPASLLS